MTQMRRHLEHVDHLVKFFQVPQAKRRRRLLLVVIPSLLYVAVMGALIGLRDSLLEVCEDWREAWDILDQPRATEFRCEFGRSDPMACDLSKGHEGVHKSYAPPRWELLPYTTPSAD